VAGDRLGATIKHDLVTGERWAHDHGVGRGAGEAVFVAREGTSASSAEDDGWLLTFVHAHDGSDASFVVLDAQDLARGPVATVPLPQRVPYGFHGNWVSDASVPPPA
jgi:carotenoid cleavage dioxygenase